MNEPLQTKQSSLIQASIGITDESIINLLELFHMCRDITIINSSNDNDDITNGLDGRRYRLQIIQLLQTLQWMHNNIHDYDKGEESKQRLLPPSILKNNNPNNHSQSLTKRMNHHHHSQSQQHDQLLLQIEQHLERLRIDIHQLHRRIIPRERQQLWTYHQSMSQQQQQQQNLWYIIQMIISDYQLHLQLEEHMIIHVLYPTLQTFYDNNRNHHESTQHNTNWQFCINTLLRRQPQYIRDGIELLLQQIEQQQQQQVELDNNEHDYGDEEDDDPIESRQQRRMRSVPTNQTRTTTQTHCHFNNPSETTGSNRCIPPPPASVAITATTTTTTTTTTTSPTPTHSTPATATSNSSVIEEMVKEFLDPTQMNDDNNNNNNTILMNIMTTNNNNNIHMLLVFGSTGSGKTYLCNSIVERFTSSLTMVIRPKLPMDMLPNRATIGEVEDILFSLFATIHRCSSTTSTTGKTGNKVLVILDDVEHIVGSDSGNESPFVQRCRSTFVALLDSLQHRRPPKLDHRYNDNALSDGVYSSNRMDVLFLLTTSFHEIVTSMTFQFNHICYLEPPNDVERQGVIKKFILGGNDNDDSDEGNEMLLNDLVESTVGKSFAEIVQLCRQSMEYVFASCYRNPPPVHESDSVENLEHHLLQTMKELLQSKAPESLRSGGYIDGYVDMRVFSARDLLDMKLHDQPNDIEGSYTQTNKKLSPSASAAAAWRTLHSSIILPLCQSKELYKLLDTTKLGNPKTIVGAVLLTGEAGSGKTTIAMRCATYAAEFLPSVKLIDVSCTSLIHKEVGASEQAIQYLFDSARRAAPVILLMDGIETIAAVRGNDATTEGTMDRILSTLLIELDGLDDSTSNASQGGVAVIGITHDETWIDSALKRPGRLDRAILMNRDWV